MMRSGRDSLPAPRELFDDSMPLASHGNTSNLLTRRLRDSCTGIPGISPTATPHKSSLHWLTGVGHVAALVQLGIWIKLVEASRVLNQNLVTRFRVRNPFRKKIDKMPC